MNIEATAAAEKSLRSYVRRANRWFTWCDASVSARLAGTECTAKRPPMPSKDAKHRAYGDADYIARQRGTNRPNTFPEMCAMVGEPCADFVARNYA